VVTPGRMWHSAPGLPELYGGRDMRRLGVEMRERGVPTVQLKAEDENGEQVNRWGLRRQDLEKALTDARSLWGLVNVDPNCNSSNSESHGMPSVVTTTTAPPPISVIPSRP
jgi:hypothetical protein